MRDLWHDGLDNGWTIHVDETWQERPHVCFFGGGSSVPASTSSTTSPWDGQAPYLGGGVPTPEFAPDQNVPGGQVQAASGIGLFPAAQALYSNTEAWPQFFGGVNGVTSSIGNTYVPLQASQNTAINQLEGIGSAGGTSALTNAEGANNNLLSSNYTAPTMGAFNAGQNYLTGMINGNTLNPFSSPGFQNVVNSTLANVLPATNASFTNGNRSDSGLASAASTAAATNAIGSLANQNYLGEQQLQQGAANTAANNYLTQQGNQVKGIALAPSLDASTISDITGGLNAGGMTQQDLQNAVNSDISEFNYNQALPFNMLGQYQNYIGSAGYGGASNITTPYYTNSTANALSGALGGAALGGALTNGSTAGSAGGAGLGALLAFL